MKQLLKKWSRRRKSRRRRNDDFSDDARRKERSERLSGTWLFRWMRKIASGIFRFHEPQWSRTRPLTKRGTVREVLSRSSYFNPLTWFMGLVRFLATWVMSRPYASLLPGLPALLVVLGVYGVVVWYRASGQTWRDGLYQQHLNRALVRKDYPVALVSIDTLIDAHPNDVQHQFRRALITKELGREQLCDQYMTRLAVTENYVPAMMWIISNHFDGGYVKDWEVEKQAQYVELLADLMLHARGDQVPAARTLMGAYMSQQGAPAEALKYLGGIANDNPELLLPVAGLWRQVGNEGRTRQYANLAREHIGGLLAARPRDTDLRVQLAKATSLSGDLEGAIRLLREGMLIAPDPALTTALAQALAMSSIGFDSEDRLGPDELARRFEYAAQALRLAPNDETVLDAVVVILTETRNRTDRQTLDVSRTLLAGVSPEVTHFIQGTIAILDNEFDEAITHLRLANAHGLDTGVMMNNLAYAMAGRDDANLDEALQLAEGAHKMLPDSLIVLETRGQILLKMKRYDEAIRDLEKALAMFSLRHLIYPSLAIAYAELGLAEKAQEYRDLASEIERLRRQQAEAFEAPEGTEQPDEQAATVP